MKKLSQIISEISTAKLTDYVAKASMDVGRRIEKAEPGVKPFKKILNRSGKIGRAKAHIQMKANEEVDCRVCGQTPCNCTSIDEASLHPDALHVSPVKVDGKTKYKVKAVGKNLAHGIKVGEHLTDTHLDDAAEMGAKIKHIKEDKAAPRSKDKHAALQSRGTVVKQAGTDESIDYRTRFILALESNGFDAEEKLVQWAEGVVVEGEQKAILSNIAKNIAGRKKSTDSDTDVIRDMDSDDTQKKAVAHVKHHHNVVKTFRTYKEEVEISEGISARQALSKAADFEFKAANTDNVDAEKRLKGKAKALRRAAKLAQDVAGVVNVGIAKQ